MRKELKTKRLTYFYVLDGDGAGFITHEELTESFGDYSMSKFEEYGQANLFIEICDKVARNQAVFELKAKVIIDVIHSRNMSISIYPVLGLTSIDEEDMRLIKSNVVANIVYSADGSEIPIGLGFEFNDVQFEFKIFESEPNRKYYDLAYDHDISIKDTDFYDFLKFTHNKRSNNYSHGLVLVEEFVNKKVDIFLYYRQSLFDPEMLYLKKEICKIYGINPDLANRSNDEYCFADPNDDSGQNSEITLSFKKRFIGE